MSKKISRIDLLREWLQEEKFEPKIYQYNDKIEAFCLKSVWIQCYETLTEAWCQCCLSRDFIIEWENPQIFDDLRNYLEDHKDCL